MKMKFENTDVFGFEAAIRGMRNPKNSWQKSDSCKGERISVRPRYYCEQVEMNPDCSHCEKEIFKYLPEGFTIGPNDLRLMQTLIRGGGEHRKFMRMIHVQVDVTMPRYFWSELDTYHFGTKNSCSTMHKLLNTDTPITPDLFVYCEEDLPLLTIIITKLEGLRIQYRSGEFTQKEKDKLLLRAKRILPEGFLQKRTWDTNYEEIRNIYHQRKHHKLKEEWQGAFCSWVECLPYFDELIAFH